MSNININNIDINYPIPGINNNSQGFRDNFSGIQANFEVASQEISDLQSKVLLKTPLANTVLDNNMNYALISRAQTQGFARVSRYMGNNLSGNVSVDVAAADVHYGTITGASTMAFVNWPQIQGEYPLASVHLILSVPTEYAASVISFVGSYDDSATTIENFTATNTGFSITAPAGVSLLHYLVYSKDCGVSMSIVPMNRPRKAQQISTVVPTTSMGRVGDKAGTIAADSNNVYVCVANYTGNSAIWKKLPLQAW